MARHWLLAFPTSSSPSSTPGHDGRLAVQAFSDYGKGRGHPAQLNLSRLPVLRLCQKPQDATALQGQ